jgi:hypothetical protein
MPKTRSELEAAVISTLDGSVSIPCMFNPEKYSVTKSNRFNTPTDDNVIRPPKPEFQGYGRSQLQLGSLIFDSYETGEDLTRTTNKLWDLMGPQERGDPQSTPAEVKFEWSTFSFQAFIESMTIDFTLFDKDGKPVRAEVSITFVESDDPTRHTHSQNPTSGGGPALEVRQIVSGDRLDLIAAEVYDDSGKWRLIADYNGINDPLAIRPGQTIAIPPN